MKTSSNSDIRKHKGSVLLSALLLAVLITTFLAANVWKRDLHFGTVRIEGNTLLTGAEILALAAIPANENLFDIDLYAVRQRLQRNHFVKNADVSRHLPDGITIAIVERVPVAALVVNHLLYVDGIGYVLPPLRPEQAFDLPVLTGNLPLADCLPGRHLREGPVKEALSILVMAKRGANELEQLISEIHIEPDSSLVIFTTESGIPVEFGRGNDAIKLAMLDGFWKQFVTQRGAKELAAVDLRFADQVVVRWNRRDDTPRQ